MAREYCSWGYCPGMLPGGGYCSGGIVRGYCSGGYYPGDIFPPGNIVRGFCLVYRPWIMSRGILSGDIVWGRGYCSRDIVWSNIRGILSGGYCPKGFVGGIVRGIMSGGYCYDTLLTISPHFSQTYYIKFLISWLKIPCNGLENLLPSSPWSHSQQKKNQNYSLVHSSISHPCLHAVIYLLLAISAEV